MRSPGVIAPCNTNRAPNHSTRAVPSAMSRSTVRSSPADNRVAYAPVARFLRFWRVKACANVPSRERARITLTAPIDSAAAAAMAPCWRRCCRAVSWMRRLRRAVETRKRGPVASASRASGAFSESITAAMPTMVSAFASPGRNAVTATSCSTPTSPMTRMTRSPVRARLWNESESRCSWLYSSFRTAVSTRLPTSANPMVL